MSYKNTLYIISATEGNVFNIVDRMLQTARSDIVIAKTVRRSRTVRHRSISYRKSENYRQKHSAFAMTYVSVRKKYKHYNQNKQIPIVVEHIPPLLTFYYNMRAYVAKFQYFCSKIEFIINSMENQIDNDTEQTVVKYIPRNATLHSLAEFFSACSDVTRAKIICALCISEMCVSDLSRILGINQTTCSHQLRLLRAADIVKQRRDGKIIYYSLKNRKIEDVLLAGVDFLNL